MQPPPPQLPLSEPSADEWLLLLAYRRCDLRDQAVVRMLANVLAGQDDGLHSADVISFPKEKPAE